MYKKLPCFDKLLKILTQIISNNLHLMRVSTHTMLYLCVNAQDYRTTIKLHDIKFRKTDKFKYLESIIPENDNC